MKKNYFINALCSENMV